MRTSSSSPWPSPTSRTSYCCSPPSWPCPSPPFPSGANAFHCALLLLALASQLNAIRKTNSNLVIIGKPTHDIKEEYDAEVEEDDADNVDESDADEFDQETG
uniref:Uncharacterized protein n=1 Tax=Avena sativa TaxID=4498 RepID=A0ACD5Z1T7_AVESA